MSYKNRKFWDNVIGGIDKELTDRAAERMNRVDGIKLSEIPDEGGQAVEVKSAPKKRSALPAIAGIGAAAAVALTVGITLYERSRLPVSDSSNPSVTSATSDVNGDVIIDWFTDTEFFEEHFMALWEAAEPDSGGSRARLELSYESYFGNICCGEQARFYENPDGYSMITGGDFPRLYFVTKDGTELYDRTNDSEGVRYVRAGEASLPDSLGCLGILMLSEYYDIPLELLTNCTVTDSEGVTWYRNGSGQADGGNIRDHNSAENSLTLSMPFHTENENHNAEKSRILTVTLTRENGEWTIGNPPDSSIDSNTAYLIDSIPEERIFDSAIFEQVFMGTWQSQNDGTFSLDYHSDLDFPVYFERYDNCTMVKGGYMIEGFAGGAGQVMFIPEDDLNLLYVYTDIFTETAFNQPSAVFRRTAFPTFEDRQLYGRLNKIGCTVFSKYISYLTEADSSFAEAFEQAQTVTTEQGEWQYADLSRNFRVSRQEMYVFELSDDRIELGLPYVRENENADPDMFYEMLQIYKRVSFVKENGAWALESISDDLRLDTSVITIPTEKAADEPRYYVPYSYSWETAAEIDVAIDMLKTEYLTEGQFDFDSIEIGGKTWYRAGNGAPYPIYRLCELSDERIVVSMPLGYDDASVGAYFRVVFEKDGESWALSGVQSFDPAALSGSVPTAQTSIDAQFSEDIFKTRFGGQWFNGSSADYPIMLPFDYITEFWGFESWSCFGDCFEDENGWYLATITGTAGSSLIEGAGHVFFIPRENPEEMFLYKDWNPDLSYSDYAVRYTKESHFDSTRFNIASGEKLNVFGRAAFSGFVNNSWLMSDFLSQSQTVEFNGGEWEQIFDTISVNTMNDYNVNVDCDYVSADDPSEIMRLRVVKWNKLEAEGFSVYETEVQEWLEKEQERRSRTLFEGVWTAENGLPVTIDEEAADGSVVHTYFSAANGTFLYVTATLHEKIGTLYYISNDDPDTMYRWYNVEGSVIIGDFDMVFTRG